MAKVKNWWTPTGRHFYQGRREILFKRHYCFGWYKFPVIRHKIGVAIKKTFNLSLYTFSKWVEIYSPLMPTMKSFIIGVVEVYIFISIHSKYMETEVFCICIMGTDLFSGEVKPRADKELRHVGTLWRYVLEEPVQRNQHSYDDPSPRLTLHRERHKTSCRTT